MTSLKDRNAKSTYSNKQYAPQYVAYECPYEQTSGLTDDGNSYSHSQQWTKYSGEKQSQSYYAIFIEVTMHFCLGFAQVPFSSLAAYIFAHLFSQKIHYGGACR